MRTIKFRGLAPKIDGAWHYGSFINNTQQDFNCYIQEDDGNVVLVDYNTVGQYTRTKR